MVGVGVGVVGVGVGFGAGGVGDDPWTRVHIDPWISGPVDEEEETWKLKTLYLTGQGLDFGHGLSVRVRVRVRVNAMVRIMFRFQCWVKVSCRRRRGGA